MTSPASFAAPTARAPIATRSSVVSIAPASSYTTTNLQPRSPSPPASPTRPTSLASSSPPSASPPPTTKPSRAPSAEPYPALPSPPSPQPLPHRGRGGCSAQTIRGERGGGALPRPVSSGEPLTAATHHLVARKSGEDGSRRSVVWGARPLPVRPVSLPPTPNRIS